MYTCIMNNKKWTPLTYCSALEIKRYFAGEDPGFSFPWYFPHHSKVNTELCIYHPFDVPDSSTT